MKGISLTTLAKIRGIIGCFGLILLCSCATEKSPQPIEPVTASMNTLAGRDDLLFIKLRSENGKDLFFAVDTGSPYTILDVSLEPDLGKSTGIRWLHYGWFSNVFAHKYKSPKLYSGNTCLLLGDSVATDNVNEKLLGRHVAGILGMDCLRHYCVQLDFEAKKIYFLDPKNFPDEDLGKSFPLVYDWGDLTTCMDFCGGKIWFGLDTGDYLDGTLKSSLLERVTKMQKAARVIERQDKSGASQRNFYFSEFALGGTTYTNLVIHKNSNGINANMLGVRFLARNLVTFNFPKQTMYLKQTSVGPLTKKSLLDDSP
jgi:hypothetical protein